MIQRWLRLERLGIELNALVDVLEVSHEDVARWVVGILDIEQSDMIEVGLAMLEMRRTSAMIAQDAPTLRLAPVLA
jgi:hypothetical protein